MIGCRKQMRGAEAIP